MKTIAIISQKGGAGKSTLSVCLAVEAQRQGRDTLLIDADNQANVFKWSQRRESEVPVVLSSQTVMVPQHLTMAQTNGAAYTIIDTPGKADRESLECARHADLVIIPTRANLFDIESISITIDMVNTLRKPHLVVINALHPNSMRKFDELRTALETEYQASVFPAYISQRAAYADCIFNGTAPQEHEGADGGKASQEITELYSYIAKLLASNQIDNTANYVVSELTP